MITAKEAWKQTKYRHEYEELLTLTEQSINRAIEDGRYKCEISIHNTRDNTAMDMLVEELKRNGYEVTISEHKDIGDPEPYFYSLNVSWEDGNNETKT